MKEYPIIAFKYSMSAVIEENPTSPYNGALLPLSPWSLLHSFTKCPAGGRKSNYETEATLINKHTHKNE